MDPLEKQHHSQEEEEEEERGGEDYFDLLPDALLHLIFNKVLDAKSLIRCLSISKRFASLAVQTDSVSLSLPRRLSQPKLNRRLPAPRFLRFLAQKFISKPLRFIRHAIARRPPSDSDIDDWYYSPSEALKELKEIKFVDMALPCYGGEIGCKGGDDPLLKWNAEFGSELKSCVIFGASSFQRESLSSSNVDREEEVESIIGEEELKSRIVWTISCLIAASMRHFLIKQLVCKVSTIQNVMVTDSSKQGKLHMGKEELNETRKSVKESSAGAEESRERTRIPDLKIKMWYVPMLELPNSRGVMWGATLIAIKPSGNGETVEKRENDGDLLEVEFDGDGDEKKAYSEAVRQMVKLKRSYVLEMKSF